MVLVLAQGSEQPFYVWRLSKCVMSGEDEGVANIVGVVLRADYYVIMHLYLLQIHSFIQACS